MCENYIPFAILSYSTIDDFEDASQAIENTSDAIANASDATDDAHSVLHHDQVRESAPIL